MIHINALFLKMWAGLFSIRREQHLLMFIHEGLLTPLMSHLQVQVCSADWGHSNFNFYCDYFVAPLWNNLQQKLNTLLPLSTLGGLITSTIKK